jgi:hypothetical protein
VNLRFAAPAILLASLLLLPFLNKPFTIDDPLFLGAAQHALADPAHPADFEQVWNAGDRLRLSQYMVGGTLPAYVLAPVAALGSREWVAHLYQWLFLCAFLLACVSVARRIGCDGRQATLVGLLVGSNPVTLAMSATSMPDLMAVTFGTFGIDRVLAYRELRRPLAGVLAALLLAAAVLCRASTVPLLVVAVLMLMTADWKRAAASLWPVAAALALAAAGALVARDAAGAGTLAGSFQSLTALRNVPRNLVSFLAFQALTGPLLVYWMLTRGRWTAAVVAALVIGGVALSRLPFANLHEYAVPAILGLCFVAAFLDLVRPLPYAWPIFIWLGAGLVALPYVYMGAKYLLPGVPAAALLIVLHAAREPQRRYPLTVAILIALGWISGAMIIVGDATLAGSGRAEAAREVPRVLRGGNDMWAGGQWSFLGYAQRAGAHALGNQPPYPRPGDYVLISRLGYYGKFEQLPLDRDLLYSTSDNRCGIFVLNRSLHAGFFSNRFGYLPFAIGCAELDRYDMYRVLDTLKN